MSLPAFTQKVGYHQGFTNYQTEWRPVSGKPAYTNGSWREHESQKGKTVYPKWLRQDGQVCFKPPTNYSRCVSRRTNPKFEGRIVDSKGLVGTYTEVCSSVMGNAPALFYTPGICENTSPYPVNDVNAYNRSVIECYLKIKNQKASLGAALAEAKSTADQLADTAARLAKLLLAARKGNWKGMRKAILGGGGTAKDALKAPSNYFLQWKYGWVPLMSDIKDSVELIKTQFPPLLPLLHAKSTTRTEPSWSFPVGAPGGRTNMVTGKGTHSTRVELWVTCNADPWRRAALNMGLDDPFGILWEVTPYSFVVDWLVPVGDFLSALSVMRDLSLVAGSVTRYAQGTSTITIPSRGLPNVEVVPPVTYDRYGFTRTVMTSLPVPMPYVKSPFSTSHTQSALALLGSLLGRKL